MTDFLNKYLQFVFNMKIIMDGFSFRSLLCVTKQKNPDNLVSILKKKCGCCSNYSSKLTISGTCDIY